MNDVTSREPGSKPNVYFIDDSATMREVVKIAFRRENFNVVTCSDMAFAVAQFEQTIPDAVISDVIMPDKDGYQLCEFIKRRPLLGGTPVFLMSGVVNKEVAERAHEVKADELIRKPFHPQDLVARVKKLLNRAEPNQTPQPKNTDVVSPLSRFFEGAAETFAKSSPPSAPTLVPQLATPHVPSNSTGLRPSAGNSQDLQKL